MKWLVLVDFNLMGCAMRFVFYLACLACSSASAYVVDTPHKTVYADGTGSDTTNALNFALSQGVDGWAVTTGTNGNFYDWTGVGRIRLTYSNNFEFYGGTVTTNFANTNSPYISNSFDINNGSPFIFTQTVPGKLINLHSLHIAEWSTNTAVNGGQLAIFYGQGLDVFRVWGLYFDHKEKRGATFWISDPGSQSGNGPWGVICSNVWDSGSGASGYGIFVRENSTAASSAWVRDGITYGSRSNVFIEYNVFTAAAVNEGSLAADGDNGGRMVFRYNSLTNYVTGNHGADEASTLTNSFLQMEILHNTFSIPAAAVDTFVRFRGGYGIVMGNTFIDPNGMNHCVNLNYYRASSGIIPGSTIDRTYPADYLGTQQPGSGFVPGTTGQDPHNPSLSWVSVPIYLTNNTVSGSLSFSYVGSDTGSTFVQNNRDFFTNALPTGYVEYTAPYPPAADPAITGQPQSTTVTVGATATFTVVASGQTAISHQWYKNGVLIVGATSASYTTPATVIGDNGSTFYDIATDTAGFAQSVSATLTVLPDPSITVQPQNQSVVVGATANFSITAIGTTAPLHYTWTFNGVSVGTDSSTYARVNCQPADNGGLVACVVSDAGGNAPSSNATLLVTGGGGGGGPSSGATTITLGTGTFGTVTY